MSMMLIFFSCLQIPFVTVMNGLGVGMMIEGGSSWGWDPMFENKFKKNKEVKLTQIDDMLIIQV